MRALTSQVLASVVLVGLARGQSIPDRLTAEQAAEDLRVLEAAVRQDWSYFDARRATKDVDLDQLLADVRRRATAGIGRRDFADALRLLVAALHDGHAGLSVPGVVAPPRRRLPLRVKSCAEGAVVTQVVEPAGASRPAGGPRVGDLLRSIDGVALDTALERARRTAVGSTPGMRERVALDSLLWNERDAVALELESPDGTRRTSTVPTSLTAPPELTDPPGGRQTVLGWPEPDVALLRIATFGVADWQRWLATAPQSRDALLTEARQRLDSVMATVNERKARALILDLRGNGGGTDLLGIHLAERLLEEPFQYFRLSAKRDGRWSAPAALTYQPRPPTFAGALVALIDSGSFSTTSNFVRCLRDLHPDFQVVGRPDGAGTGAPRKIATLPHSGAEVTLCTHRVYGPRSGLIEGVGTPPDRAVTWTRADVLSGTDPDQQAALRLLAR